MEIKNIVLVVLGFLLCIAGHSTAKDCDYNDFGSCVKEVVQLETGDFHITNEEQMKEVCKAKRKAIQCTSNYMNDCMKKGEKEIYEATIGGKLKVVEEMCMDGSNINKGYLQNIDCWGKAKEDMDFCNKKFNESLIALSKGAIEDRLKVFYGCCAFEWHRNCLAKVARSKCNDEAGDFVYYISTALGGSVQKLMCSSSYSSCHGLHGVDQQEIEEKFETISSSSMLWLQTWTVTFITVACIVLSRNLRF